MAPPPAPGIVMMEAADIVVSATRRADSKMKAPVTVSQENLGDLKLYRVPMPTTVAANAQKQVMLAQKRGVAVTPFVQADVYEASVQGDAALMLRTRNRKEEGLGLPLPGGPITVFEPRGENAVLIGEGGVPDKAVGEDLDLRIGTATQMTLEASETWQNDRSQNVTLTASNARSQPVRLEVRISKDSGTLLLRALGQAEAQRRRDVVGGHGARERGARLCATRCAGRDRTIPL